MTTIVDNEAAWLESFKGYPLKVGPGPKQEPAEDEIVIKVAYAAVNPLDWKLQDGDSYEMPFPNITGVDIAGTVVQLGSKVTRFQLGQRVLGLCNGLIVRKTANCGWQKYSTCPEIHVSAIPDSLPLANASVLPLSISTAAVGLFIELQLELPSLDPKPTGKTVFIWGGSSSCGSSAIQLAIAAGYQVATTASPANFEYVKDLGASYVFDHRNPKIVGEVLKVLKPGDYVFDCISTAETLKPCGEILGKIGGGRLAVLNTPEGSFMDNIEPRRVWVWQPALLESDLGDTILRKYLPAALAAGKLKAKPDPMIIEGGLEKVQEGIDLQRVGVSAKKIVIEIAKE
ncbi:putative zinc binding dehydrogenase [Talaromyces proteolyticus]|uniref:Zinc binding dehydrogenase n=1 Tax=Talaromyces proteolyticus TaxID=1131652 RepID=A0AAD4KPM6_9EURO|nr:putative zinc binding dehydrogenase [Talaromyces proteolyticus]KAH8697538.1 putative zinc binding dehydrogenase [Talaromyces proteolyticus]